MNIKMMAGMTTRAGVVIALAVLALLCAPTANAGGFNGYYDYSTWTASSNFEPGPGIMVRTIDGSQQTLTMYENNGSDYEGPEGETWFNFSHTVASSGTVSFNWSFNWNIDPCCSGFNFYINSTLYNLADGYPGNGYNETGGNASGYFSALVAAGDIITFQAYSADDCCGAANTVITNFDGGSGVPEPASLLLIGAGLTSLAAWRRIKRQR